MDFDYRLATEEWLDLLDGAMKETAAGLRDSDIFVADDRESLRRHLEAEGRILMALDTSFKTGSSVQDTSLAGFLMVRFPGAAKDNLGVYAGISADEMDRVAHMESVTVRAAYRGYGLQRRLVEQGESLAVQLGYKYSMCTVAPQNPWSLANMQDAGYSIVATVPKYGGLMRHILFKVL